jgi:hypothetical protein
VSGGSEGDRGGDSRRLNDGKRGSAVVATGGGGGKGCSFYTHRRRLAKGGVSYGRGRQSSGGHGLNAVGTGGTIVIS